MRDEEITHKNAALWLQYSTLSVSRSGGSDLFDIGGCAKVPAREMDAPRNAAGRVQRERTDRVVSENERNLS